MDAGAAFSTPAAIRVPVVGPTGDGRGRRAGVPWLRIKSGRDLGVALAIFGLVATRQRRAAGVFVLACTVMPVVDALTTWSNGASPALALSVHGGAAAYVLVLALALLQPSAIRGHRP
ncbi:DUF4267 domain-containing protein [Sorangium sp. So ce119]|uniref:DUF4267 domain-containing protein n=1 Tax=Sorangium sp. So ce119 TaxID=3133279 RepID=UPI003F5EE59E